MAALSAKPLHPPMRIRLLKPIELQASSVHLRGGAEATVFIQAKENVLDPAVVGSLGSPRGRDFFVGSSSRCMSRAGCAQQRNATELDWVSASVADSNI